MCACVCACVCVRVCVVCECERLYWCVFARARAYAPSVRRRRRATELDWAARAVASAFGPAVRTDKHKLPVVDKMTQATSAPGVFAAGDVAKARRHPLPMRDRGLDAVDTWCAARADCDDNRRTRTD